MSAELRALDAQLPGTLINDPSVIDWEVYGDIADEPVRDASIPGGGAALRVEVKTASEFIYTAGIKLPLTKKAETGKDITIGFYARTVTARTPDGNGVVRVRFQKDEAPFPGFGEETLSIGKDWDWYEVTADVEQTLRTKDGIAVIQFGRTKQTLEFGQVIIVKGAKAIAAAPAPTSTAPKPAPSATLPASLQGAGTLINDPSKANWHFEGPAGEFNALDDVAIFGTQATRLTVTKANSKPHDLFAAIPLTGAIAEGDELLIAIAARSAADNGSAAPAQFAIRIEEAKPPYDGFSDNQIALNGKWRLIRVNTKAPRALAAGEGQLALHFGGALKTVDIGPVYILKSN
ncbi:hypothetical protein [Pontixanthobacter aquaemixtae]|uniref:Uncharacterized protein n=1 Tax=Pontixanthobacter aquaemixtae TaxID=1958940 RepID=A0A844ZTH9_9SPHN|nr:hypothetical protein [Pontixanthobacter aquaemixtae]MXO90306.1 hypothetical protein [Pontixanthobacter aquaemixtae]